MTGKFPVWSVEMVPSFCSAIVAPMNNSTSTFASMAGRKSCSITCVSVCRIFVVDLVCFRTRLRWPLAVVVDSGKYLHSCADVMGGKPMSWSLSSALQNVSTIGEKRHWCMYWMVLASVVV